MIWSNERLNIFLDTIVCHWNMRLPIPQVCLYTCFVTSYCGLIIGVQKSLTIYSNNSCTMNKSASIYNRTKSNLYLKEEIQLTEIDICNYNNRLLIAPFDLIFSRVGLTIEPFFQNQLKWLTTLHFKTVVINSSAY